VASFEAEVEVDGVEGGPVPGVFIRAPVVEETGPGVEVLATLRGNPVVVRQGATIACSFHPELTGDARLHGLWLQAVRDHAQSL
jgi:5'-phosphate synthase pdxT subunit